MIALAAPAVLAAHGGSWAGHPFWPFFLLIPFVFLLLVLAVVFVIVRRRRLGVYGPPWARHPYGYDGPAAPGARSAERILAERFARGEVDEAEYRARLEVLRADRPEG